MILHLLFIFDQSNPNNRCVKKSVHFTFDRVKQSPLRGRYTWKFVVTVLQEQILRLADHVWLWRLKNWSELTSYKM